MQNNAEHIIEKLRRYLVEQHEPNPYLIYKGVGDGKLISEKFNVKIYQGKNGFSIVTNDQETYQKILDGTIAQPKAAKQFTLFVDDSGWGFPVGPAFVGACLEPQGILVYDEVEVKYFQEPLFSQKAYLDEYARKGAALVSKLLADNNLSKDNVKIVICTGYLNTKLKDTLRELGFDVEVGEIKGKLQTELECITRDTLNRRYNFNLYYDPKETSPVNGFQKVIKWINECPEERLKFAKTGWEYFKKQQINRG